MWGITRKQCVLIDASAPPDHVHATYVRGKKDKVVVQITPSTLQPNERSSSNLLWWVD